MSMRVHAFTAILAREPLGHDLDAVFEAFDGAPPTVGNRAGVPYAVFSDVEASSLGEALHAALVGLRRAGLEVDHFEVEPEAVEA